MTPVWAPCQPSKCEMVTALCGDNGQQFLATFLRVMITLSAGSAIVLSSISVCDGRWLSSPRGRGLWEVCPAGACSEEAESVSRVMVAVRALVCLALAVAILALEMLMVSQLCEEGDGGRRRWALGALLLLLAFLLSAAGTLTYLCLLMDAAAAFTLPFWCQFLAITLFCLNAASALYLNQLTAQPITRRLQA